MLGSLNLDCELKQTSPTQASRRECAILDDEVQVLTQPIGST
jgi:hypothetical protein